VTAPATVAIAQPAGADFIRSQHAVWASLPMSLTAGAAGAQMIAVDGQSPGWLETLAEAIRPDVAGVLLVRPGAGPPARRVRAAAEAAASTGTAVVVETAWASNPAVPQLARAIAGRLPDTRLIDSVAQVAGERRGQWADVLLDHVALLRAVTGPLDAVRFAVQDVHGYTVDGVRGASTVAMAALRSAVSPPGARLAAYGATAEAHLVVPTGDTAAPAAAWIVDPAGATAQPMWCETTSRVSWRRLHSAVSEASSGPSSDLSDLADDIELVAAITESWPIRSRGDESRR
jgi:hypothetical protein